MLATWNSCWPRRATASPGLSPLDLARQTDLGDYDGWLDRERIVGNLHRAYADLGAAEGVNVIGALTDMVAFNGGTYAVLRVGVRRQLRFLPVSRAARPTGRRPPI